MAICKNCGDKYSRWTTPVSAKGVRRDCFEAELDGLPEAESSEDASFTAPPPAKKPNVRIHVSSFIPRSRSKVVFALVMSCYCWTLSSLVSTWRYAVHVKSPPRAFYLRGDASDAIALLLFAPVIESLLLVGVLELVRRARAPGAAQIFVAASLISVMHVWPWWPHAAIVLPSFCIQAAAYLYWRRVSWKVAYWVLVSIHALNNFIPTLSVLGRAARHA